MKVTGLCVVVTCSVLAGCAPSSYYVGGPGANMNFSRAQKHLTGKEVTVVLVNAEPDEGRVLQLTPDSLLWVSTKWGDIRSARLSSVTCLVGPPSTDQQVGGGLAGFFGGSVAGGLLALLAVSDMTDFDAKIGVALTLGLGGMIGGTILGVTSPADTRYMFHGSPPPNDGGGAQLRAGEYYVLTLSSLLDESPTSVTILWSGAPRVIPKAQIVMERPEEGKYVLRIPKRLLGD